MFSNFFLLTAEVNRKLEEKALSQSLNKIKIGNLEEILFFWDLCDPAFLVYNREYFIGSFGRQTGVWGRNESS